MNFALILFVLLLITGALWVADRYVFRKQRQQGAKDPWWVEYGAGFFPVILLVFGLRSFVVEPFQIPSGSMIPTLVVGDFILVNKFTYGLRLPILHKKIVDIGQPARGDVMVFRYPENPSLDYIKRVVGLPGDTVRYQGKVLTLNGKLIERTLQADYYHPERLYYSRRYSEQLGDTQHDFLNDEDAPAGVPDALMFPGRDLCRYNHDGFECTVPEGHYFVMGDNRDNSRDSRVWGFVPEENIVGRAFFIWLNFSQPGRIGRFQ